MSTPTPIPPPHFATPEEITRTLDRECQRLQAENAKLWRERNGANDGVNYVRCYGCGKIIKVGRWLGTLHLCD